MSERRTIEDEENELRLGTAQFGGSAVSWEEGTDENIVVIDIGSSELRCGFAGEDKPRVAFPIVVGRPKGRIVINHQVKDVFVGAETLTMGKILDIKYVTHNSIVKDWDNMEKILYHTFYNEL